MSRWHRENPELAGTGADPWMSNPSYARASEDVARLQGDPLCECGHRESSHFQVPGRLCIECSCDFFTEVD